MAAYDLEEQEQLSAIKDWWEKYGTVITVVALVVAILVAGWALWARHQVGKAEEASALFGSLIQALDKKDTQTAKQLSGKLLSDYDGTTQAHLGALLVAKTSLDANDPKAAKPKLEHIVAEAKDPLIRDVARLRLAAVLLDEKAFDPALKVLQATPHDAFAARFADLRGDIYFAKGATADALGAYKTALTLLGNETTQAPLKPVIETKIEALGGQ